MKKLLCCTLFSLFMISMLVIGVNATTLEEELETQFFYYSDGDKWDLSYWYDDVPYVSIFDYVEVDDVVFFSAVANFAGSDSAPATIKIGNCVMYTGGTTYPSNVGMYARIEGEIYSIEEAWEYGLVTDLSPVIGFSRYTRVYPVGDADLDYEVSILDATQIQMKIAQLIPSDKMWIFEVADVDADYEITILDATAIQMKLAKID